jgi:hypothetical protein
MKLAIATQIAAHTPIAMFIAAKTFRNLLQHHQGALDARERPSQAPPSVTGVVALPELTVTKSGGDLAGRKPAWARAAGASGKR